jgi:D-alanyl-D-alanine carboxypeptidase (penicillin-binding protein 5/6)
MVQKNGTDKLIARIVYTGPIRAPVQSDQRVGTFRLWRNGNLALEVPVHVAKSIGTGSITSRAFDGASELTIGLLRSGIEKL